MTRQEFIAKVRRERYAWALRVDPKAVEMFNKRANERIERGRDIYLGRK